MNDQFHKKFYKDYQFWTFIVSILSLSAIAFFAFQAQKIQLALKSMETTRQKGNFCDDLKVYFDIDPSSDDKLEKAGYELKLLNNSSHIFDSLKTSVTIFFENQDTKEKKTAEAFTFPPRDLLPSNKPAYLVENPQLSETFQFNITEARKGIPETFQPKFIYFYFQWQVKMSDGEDLEIEKHKNFILE